MPAVIASGPTFGDGSGGLTVVNAAPAGLTDRDWLLAVLLSDNDGDAAAMTAPAGWYQVSSSADTVTTLGGFGKIWTRRAVDAGAGPYNFPGGSGSDNTGFVFRIAGADPVQLFAAPPVWANPGAGATTSLIAPSVTPGGSGLLICMFMLEGMFGGSISPPGGMSGTSVLNATGFMQTLPGSETVPPGPTGTRTATATTSGASNLHGFLAVSMVLADDTSSTYAGWFLGPPTFGRPWVPASPQWAGGEFIPPPQVEATTGVGALGMASTAVVRKVVAVTATTGLGLSSTGTAQKVTRAAGTAALAVTTTTLARKATPATGSGTLGVAGTVSARKASPATGAATTGLAGTVTLRKTTPAAARSLAGLASTTVARKVSPVTGSGLVGFTSTGQLADSNVRAVTARTLIGLTGSAQARKRSSAAGITTLGATSTGTIRKVSGVLAGARFGITTYFQSPGRVHVYTGTASVSSPASGAAGVTAPHASASSITATQAGEVAVQ